MSLKKQLTGILLILSFYSTAQLGFGIRGGFQQSIPLVMRDSFSGKPSLFGAINLYIPYRTNLNFVAGINYREVSLSHKIEPTGLYWQTLALNIGTEWKNNKFTNTSFYTGINTHYVLTFAKNTLSGNASSGIGYTSLKTEQKLVPSVELGINFKPRPFINFNISTLQPIPQSTKSGRPTLPGTLSFGIEYRLTAKDIKNRDLDTSPSAEKVFTKNLKAGVLYFIEDGTDSSQKVFRKMIKENYFYSAFSFIKANQLNQLFDSIAHSADSNMIFIAKTGSIVYSTERAGTQGIIVYNYNMQNPIPDQPFFIRNLVGDSNLEDPLVVRKMIIKLNKRLAKLKNS